MDDSSSIDFKFVESYFKDKFLKPFARRLNYIYFGFDHHEDLFIFSDTEDLDFKYCEALQTTGLIEIKNKEHFDKIAAWFHHYQIDKTTPCLFYLSRLITILNKVSWNNPDIKITCDQHKIVTLSIDGYENIVICRPIDTHFTLTKLQSFADKYRSVFFKDIGSYYDETSKIDTIKSIATIIISCDHLYQAGLLDDICHDVKLVLLSGLDLLVFKSLIVPDKEYISGIRLWAEHGKKCINYGSFYKDADISICTSRDNIFIFPIAKKG